MKDNKSEVQSSGILLQYLICNLKNRLHFAVVCSVIDTRYDVIMCKGH